MYIFARTDIDFYLHGDVIIRIYLLYLIELYGFTHKTFMCTLTGPLILALNLRTTSLTPRKWKTASRKVSPPVKKFSSQFLKTTPLRIRRGISSVFVRKFHPAEIEDATARAHRWNREASASRKSASGSTGNCEKSWKNVGARSADSGAKG